MAKGIWGRIVREIRYWTWSDWSLADTAAHYDHLAEDYDEINESTDAHFRRFTDATRLAPLPDGARVLEIFSRTGEGMAYFSQRGNIDLGVCVDVSRKMGEICQQRLQNTDLKDFRWVQESPDRRDQGVQFGRAGVPGHGAVGLRRHRAGGQAQG